VWGKKVRGAGLGRERSGGSGSVWTPEVLNKRKGGKTRNKGSQP